MIPEPLIECICSDSMTSACRIEQGISSIIPLSPLLRRIPAIRLHTDTMEINKNPAQRCAVLLSYPCRRSLLSVLVQRSSVICDYPINGRSVYKINGTRGFNQSRSSKFWGIWARIGPGFVRQQAAAIQARQFFTKSRFYGEIFPVTFPRAASDGKGMRRL